MPSQWEATTALLAARSKIAGALALDAMDHPRDHIFLLMFCSGAVIVFCLLVSGAVDAWKALRRKREEDASWRGRFRSTPASRRKWPRR